MVKEVIISRAFENRQGYFFLKAYLHDVLLTYVAVPDNSIG